LGVPGLLSVYRNGGVTLANVIAPLKIFVDRTPSRFGGSDVVGLVFQGVPVIDYHQDAGRYFDIHHSADDTLDKIDRDKIDQNVAAWAALLYVVAESDVDLRPAAPVKPPPRVEPLRPPLLLPMRLPLNPEVVWVPR